MLELIQKCAWSHLQAPLGDEALPEFLRRDVAELEIANRGRLQPLAADRVLSDHVVDKQDACRANRFFVRPVRPRGLKTIQIVKDGPCSAPLVDDNDGMDRPGLSQAADQLQGKPRTTEARLVLDPHARGVDLDPFRLDVVDQFLLPCPFALRCQSDTQPPFFVELAEVSDHSLSRASLCSVRLNQRPVSVSLTVLLSIVRANEHARILSQRLHQTSQA